MSLVVQLLVVYLLSNAAPEKEKARQYIKDKLNGWQETIALVMFDAAWNAALAAAGSKVGTLDKVTCDTIASCAVEASKGVTSEA